MIQTVSADQKTFVIRKGSENDVRIGMEALFSTKNATIKAKVLQTTRFFSVWSLKEKDAKFPFKKKSYVIYNKELDTIWYSVPTVKTNYNYRAWKPKTYWTFKTGYSYTVAESTTETAAKDKPLRINLSAQIMWHKEVRPKRIDWGWGMRYDSETARTPAPTVFLPTTRLLLNTEFTFHFPRLRKTKNNFYGTIGVAFGQSTTTIDTETTVGYALIFPQVTLGFAKQFGDESAILFEATAEVISSEEQFDDGTLQSTNTLNGKVGIGFKF